MVMNEKKQNHRMMCAIEANKQPNNGWTSHLMHKRTIKTEKGQTNNALTDKYYSSRSKYYSIIIQG